MNRPLRPAPVIATATGQRWLPDPGALVPPPPAGLVPWLTEPGLLTDRLRARYAGDLELVIVDQRLDRLAVADQRELRAASNAAFVREIELWCAGRARVFAQTLVPEATLASYPWLAELGRSTLGEALAHHGMVERGELEFAACSPGAALYERALRAAAMRPATLWARRSWFAGAGLRLLVQEVFLPGLDT